MSIPVPPAEIKRHLKDSTLFRELPTAALDHLAREVFIRDFGAATSIFERNSVGEEFFIVLEGSVELIIPTHPSVPKDPLRDKLMKNTRDAVVDTREPGEFFGELACLAENGTRTATAFTPKGCSLLVVPREPFLDTLRQFPDAALAVLRQVADRLRWHTDHLAKTVRRDGLVRPEDRDAQAECQKTLWQVLCDWARQVSTSLWFTLANLLLWAVWLGFNGPKLLKDLPTIDGLTMFVSLQAIVMTILILVSEVRAEQKAKLREETQFTNTHVAVEQTTVILHRLIQLETELRHYRLKADLRDRRRTQPQAQPPPNLENP